MEYCFNTFNTMAAQGILLTLNKFLKPEGEPPVILCIGSDLAIGDSLGPIVGTQLRRKASKVNAYIYGTLAKPITAKEVRYLNSFLHSAHPHSKIVTVDAAVGSAGDIGLIKVCDRGLRPGLGANKKFDPVGDVCIMGIVAEKSIFNYSLLNLTRLNLVYKMAEIVSQSIADLLLSSVNIGKFIA